VFKVLEKIGFPQAEKCFHLQYAMVELPDGAMSSRKGNIIPLSHLLKSMEEQIKQQYLNKYLTGEKPWTISEVNKTASIIADGAIKYGMLKIDNGRIIVFDMNEWLKLDGDTGPYLQYVYARISSLIEKVNAAEHSESPDWSKLSTEMEMNLMVKLSLFNDIVLQSAEQMKPSLLCGYLYDLGKFFNVFYNQCPIGKAENLELQFARLRLAKATGLVMAKGLEILGIKAPSRM
jgi:arginyl-tRNA synthetase